jgi:heptosyltransferase-3
LTYSSHDTLRDHLTLLGDIRSRKFDLVFDFMDNPRSALYTLVSGAKHRVGFESVRRWVYNTIVPRTVSYSYIVGGKYTLLEGFHVKAREMRLVLPWFDTHVQPTRDLAQVNRSFAEAPVRVVLSPTHRREARRWPMARFAELSDRLRREWGASVLWLWGPGEEQDIEGAIALCQEQSFKAPKTSFREMAALIANCDVFIGNSNGPSHVAVAVDTPSLQLHGPTYGVSWSPNTPAHRYLQGQTMEDLSVEGVLDALAEMKPAIMASVARRQVCGFRSHWQQD